MKLLYAVLREFIGLFVDDGALALEVVAVVLVAGVISIMLPDRPLVAGAVILFGNLGVLFLNVLRAGRSG